MDPNYLIFAETVFYAVFSLAIFVLSILLCIVAYHFIGIARHLRKITEDIDMATEEVKNRIEDIVEALSNLPLISFLFKKGHKKENNKKGRN